MSRLSKQTYLAILFVAAGAAAQTTVTNSNNGTTGTVPVYNGKAKINNSPIVVSGGNIGIGTTAPSALLNIGESVPSGKFDFYVGQPPSALSGWVQYAAEGGKANIVSVNDAAATSGDIWAALDVVAQDNSTNGIAGMLSYASATNPPGTVNPYIVGIYGSAMLESAGTVTE